MPDRDTDKVERVYAGTGFYVSVALAIVGLTALIIFIAQNTDSVPVEFLWWDFSTPLVVLVLVAALIAAVGDEVIGWIWRRRRRRVMNERAELARLRKARSDEAAAAARAAKEATTVKDEQDDEGDATDLGDVFDPGDSSSSS